MPRSFAIYFALILLLMTNCTSQGESTLSKALSAAVKDEKISQGKMESILKEYDVIRDEDKKKAREYLLQIVNAIEMGGDSSHIDVVRRQVVRSKGVQI